MANPLVKWDRLPACCLQTAPYLQGSKVCSSKALRSAQGRKFEFTISGAAVC